MDMSHVIARNFSSVTTGTKNKDGAWELTVTMTETLAYPNGSIRDEVITFTATDPEYHIAHKLAMGEVLTELQNLVYARGFDSLIEAREYERGLQNASDLEVDEVIEPK